MSKFTQEMIKYLPQARDIFGLKIFADASVPTLEIDHAANILAQYIDNDEDGSADNSKVIDAMLLSLIHI